MTLVSFVQARWILDSRGLPTLACEVILDQNGRKFSGSASVPSGASTGSHEALEMRDGDRDFHGKGVNKAIFNVNQTIAGALANREFSNAVEIDQALIDLDGTEHKTNLGANAILAVSMASHRAFANLSGLPLWQYLRRLYFSNLPATPKFPRLMCNVINGGVHADNQLSVQEFMIIPNTRELEKDIQLASEVYHTLKKTLKKNGLNTNVGDEGGFAPQIHSTEEVLTYLQNAVTDSGYTLLDCNFGLDAASTEFYHPETQTYTIDGQDMSRSQLVDFYQDLCEKFNLLSLEDVFAEDDLLGWELATEKLGKKRTLVGDDLFVTNVKRFEEIAEKQHIANCVLIKLNQIGTVLETCQIINRAKENTYSTSVSHRSGETTDTFISDLAFASQSEFIKLGAPARGERVVKYNRLLEIYDSLT
jgi:enolase